MTNRKADEESLFTNSLWQHFANVTDPRASDNQKYKFKHLLIMIVCAILCGADDIESIVNYIEAKIEWFQERLGILEAPSYKAIWWVMVLINPQELHEAFGSLIKNIRRDLNISEATEEEKEHISIDGKTSRGTRRENIKALHMVSAWSSSWGLLLGQVKTDEKSNEITAIPKLLEMLNLENTIITIDAIGCQTAIADQITESGGDYVLALKGNQETIHEEVKAVFAEDTEEDQRNIDHVPIVFDKADEIDKGHGRIEGRQVRVCQDIEWLKKDKKWKSINSVIEIVSRREIKGKESCEKRYYISSAKGSAAQFLKWIRNHWQIESFHWVLDVAFKDDNYQGHTGHIAENMSVLKGLTLNLLKQNSLKKSIPKKRERAGWDNNYLLELLKE